MATPTADTAWYRSWAREPIFAWVRPEASVLCQLDAFPSLPMLNELLGTACDRAQVRRVTLRQSPKKGKRRPPWRGIAETYDGHIIERAQVPSREDNWHDLMNALSWVCFPRSKWTLHQAQYNALRMEVERLGGARPKIRGRERDRLTLLDEAGLLQLQFEAGEPDELSTPTRSASLGPEELQPRPGISIPFGHALYENVALGRPEVTPWLFEVPVPAARCRRDRFAGVDSRAANELQALRDAVDQELSRAITHAFDARPGGVDNSNARGGQELTTT